MRHRQRYLAALAAALALVLAGCSLARPERQGESGAEQEDRFVGVYLVYNPTGTWQPFDSNPNLVDYGETVLHAEGIGSFAVPRAVLIARFDQERGTYSFPDLEGWALFSCQRTDEDGPYSMTVSDMDNGNFVLESSDQGSSETLEGTVYCGPPADAGTDWDPYEDLGGIWHAYQVYQAADGTVYTDGSGNSYSGGGSMGFTISAEHTTTVNGETTTDAISVAVHIEAVPRLERLVVSQFDAENALLRSQEIPLGEELEPATCGADAAWVLVEAHNTDGTVERTVYSLPVEEPLYHPVVILDERGVGTAAGLLISQDGPGAE